MAPLMVVNFYLVLITLLQHTHPSLPHYDDAEWDWLRGALSTVDRDYGFLNYGKYCNVGSNVCTLAHILHVRLCTEWDWLRGALSTVDRGYGFLNYGKYFSVAWEY